MSEPQSLESFLGGLGTPQDSAMEFTVNTAAALRKMSRFQLPHPALWAVKMVQGAVVCESFGVEFAMTRDRLLCTVYGAPVPSAHALLKLLLSGNTPADRGHHHWIVALRSLYGGSVDGWGWSSTKAGNTETVKFWNGEPVTELIDHKSVEVDTLSVELPLQRSGLAGVKLGVDEYYLLCKHCSLCPIPVTVDKRLISQQHPGVLVRGKYAALWMEKTVAGNASFPLSTSPPGKNLPPLIATKILAEDEGLHPCSLLVCVSPARLWRSAFEVYWLRDGALLGPRSVREVPSQLDIVVVCPGENISLDLSEWSLRNLEEHFPASKIHKVIQEIGTALHPLIEKNVHLEDGDFHSWFQGLGRPGEILGKYLSEFLQLFTPLEKKIGLPPEFVNAIIDLSRRENLLLE